MSIDRLIELLKEGKALLNGDAEVVVENVLDGQGPNLRIRTKGAYNMDIKAEHLITVGGAFVIPLEDP